MPLSWVRIKIEQEGKFGMKNKSTIYLLIILVAAVFSQVGSRGTGQVFAAGDYPYLGVQTPINVPNCVQNSTTAVVSNDTQLQTALSNGSIKVICMNPGSYAEIMLEVSGTAQSPRYLIPNHPTNQPLPKPWNQAPNQRVTVDTILYKSAYWYVVGLNVRQDTGLIVEFRLNANGNVADSLLIEGISERLAPGSGSRTLARIRETAFYNTIQNSVFRNPPRVPYEDSHCLVIRDSPFNTIINNQFYDCAGDGIQINTVPTVDWDNRGNKILNNEIYLTNRLYAVCSDPSIDANLNGPGDCACAENGIDVKYNVESPVTTSQEKTVISGNHLYGFKQTHQSCGGTGDDTAPAIYLHNEFTKDILIEGNLLANSDTGVLLRDTGNGGPDNISFLNNMLYNIHTNRAINFSGGVNNQFSHNTIVLTTTDGNLNGRHSIAIVGNAGSGIVSNNLVLSTNDQYRGYTDVTNISDFTVINNAWVRMATPITGIGSINDMVFPNDPLGNYAQYCFDSQKHTSGVELCFPYLVPGPNAATVDVINTTNYGVPYDFLYRPRSLPYDAGATEVPIFNQFTMLPSILGN
jgi:hypothetical protein